MSLPSRWLIAGFALVVACSHGEPCFAGWSYDPPQGIPVITGVMEPPFQAIAADGSSGVFVAWRQASQYKLGPVSAQHVLSTGDLDPSWPAGGLAPYPPSPSQNHPVIVSDGTGGAFLVCDDGQGVNVIQIYAYHLLASGTVDPSWPANGVRLCDHFKQTNPQAVMDDSGGAIVAWIEFRGAFKNDIFAARVGSDGSVSPGSSGAAVCTAMGDQFLRTTGITPDSQGGAFIAWDDFRAGGPYQDIYVAHLLRDATVDPAWPVNGVPVGTIPGPRMLALLVGDSHHGAYAFWTDGQNLTYWQACAQHILPNGTLDPAWPANGLVLNPSSSDQSALALMSDTKDGVLAVWQDSGLIRIQHLLAAGTADPAWPAGGRTVALANAAPVAISDGGGGSIIVWSTASTYPDIYAQHVLSSGQIDPTWPVNGRAIAIAPGAQGYPVVATDEYGGAIVAYEDDPDIDSGGTYGVYAAHVPLSATLGVPAPSPLAGSGSLTVAPNPARLDAAIGWAVSSGGSVALDVFDLRGRRVRLLAQGAVASGVVHWNLRDYRGRRVAAGVYIVRAASLHGAISKMMVVTP